jgi:hypothetical protein
MWKLTRSCGALLGVAAMVVLSACGGGASGANGDVATLERNTSTTAAPDTDGSGDSPNDDSTVTEAERQEAMLAFTQCMREHGVDMPDPQFDENGRGVGGAIRVGGDDGLDQEDFEAAQEACEDLLGDVRGSFGMDDPEQRAKMQEQMLAFSQCMREHGIDMPDPQFSEDGGATIQGGPGGSIDPDDPDFQAAEEACRGDMPGFRTEVRRGSGDDT